MYKYETHMHTAEASACSNSCAADMADKYKAEGYDGIIVTDHFFNGNTCVPKELPWEERVDRYCLGYEHAKARGDEIGLDVFFGFEYGNGASDYLVYGLGKEWLKANPQIMELTLKDFILYAKQEGGMVFQAHPFRQAEYIYTTEHAPRLVDGIEIYNASHKDPRWNERAAIFASWYDLPGTGGSDAHNTTDKFYGGGILFPRRFTSALDYAKAVVAREITVLTPPPHS